MNDIIINLSKPSCKLSQISMEVNPAEIQEKLASALQLYLSEDKSVRDQVIQFLFAFKSQDQIQYITYLIIHLSNPQTTAQSRTIAAVLIYSTLHKRTLDAQCQFVKMVWAKFPNEIKDRLCESATQALTSDDMNLANQCGNLLGLFYAFENYLVIREPIAASFFQLIDAATNSPDPNFRMLLYNIFTCFAINSLELNPQCYLDSSQKNISPHLFNVFLAGMGTDYLPLQIRAIEAFTDSFLIFKRYFSLNQNHPRLINAISTLFQTGIPELVAPLYSLLRTCIDYCYNDMTAHMEIIELITVNDFQSGVPERQVEACFLWSVVAEVESDIRNTDKHPVKFKHRDFCITENIVFSRWAFDQLFNVLVILISSTNPNETDAHISLERTPSHAAFSCLNSLTKAVGPECLPRIYEYVQQNSTSEDWRLRYTSGLLLNAASQFKKNITVAFDFYVNALIDPVPRISEVAMWSLGLLIKKKPDLILENPQRFGILCENVSQRMNVSDELTSRACWLLNNCFNVFSRDDEESPLVQNFEKFSTLLLECADKFDINAQSSAFGALDRLIEHTPSTIAEQYNKLFSMVTAKLQFLIVEFQNENVLNSPKYTQQMIGLLTLVHDIVMNVGPMISNVSDQLMSMLIAALDFQNGNFICEVLPAMGAVARAIRQDFTKYLGNLIEKVFNFLSEPEYVQPAAVFVSDIFNSFPDPPFPDDFTEKFVLALFETLNFETLQSQSRTAVFSALANIATYIGPKCAPWIEKYIELLEAEAKSVLVDTDDFEANSIKSFAVENLSIYMSLVPIMAKIQRGDRKVRSFFHIFEKINKIDALRKEVLPDCIILIAIIAETFQRKMNVYLNKPCVKELLEIAIKDEDNQNPKLAEFAAETLEKVKSL